MVGKGEIRRSALQRLREAGARDYLTKPLDVEALLRVLDGVSVER